MGRFLLFFSYLGTNYRGMQIQREAGEVIQRIKTVQGVLEEGLKQLRPTNEVILKTSSRTDSNVHALCNAAHVDLLHKKNPLEFNPHWITVKLNKFFTYNTERLRWDFPGKYLQAAPFNHYFFFFFLIRILHTIRVPDNFHSRSSAIERSYVYRMAIMKKQDFYSDPASSGLPWGSLDEEFCSKVYPPFDMDKFRLAALVLTGQHNFLSFTTKTVLKSVWRFKPDGLWPLRIHIKRGSALMGEHRPNVYNAMEHWEVHFCGKSFLYKQIRRMMGAMVAVAKGHVTLEQLKDFLGNPSIKNPGRIQALPGYGLFLKEVRYPGHVYNYNRSELRLMEVLEDPAGRQHISECVPARTDLAVCDPAEDLVNVDSKADVGLLDTNVTAMRTMKIAKNLTLLPCLNLKRMFKA